MTKCNNEVTLTGRQNQTNVVYQKLGSKQQIRKGNKLREPIKCNMLSLEFILILTGNKSISLSIDNQSFKTITISLKRYQKANNKKVKRLLRFRRRQNWKTLTQTIKRLSNNNRSSCVDDDIIITLQFVWLR